MKSFVLFSLLIFLATLSFGEDSVMGCGGFVRLPSGATTDLSGVRVKAVRDDVEASSADCSPSGYFFIPLYEPGTYSFVVVPPKGLSISPEKFESTVAAGAECSIDAFSVTGFELSGSLSKALPDVHVALFDTKTGKGVSVAHPDSKTGEFSFTNVAPGHYRVVPERRGTTFTPASLEIETSSSFRPHEDLSEKFSVVGFDITAKFASGAYGNNVVLALYRKSKSASVSSCPKDSISRKDVPRVSEIELASNLDKSDFLCAVPVTQETVVFSGAKSGDFVLVPVHSAYTLSPASSQVSVSDSAVQPKETFRVSGLTLNGHVFAQDASIPLGGVSVSAVVRDARGKTLMGPVETTTDTNGAYRLSNIPPDSVIDVSVARPHYQFNQLKDFAITTEKVVKAGEGKDSLPKILASSVQVCGHVLVRSVKHPVNVEFVSSKNEKRTAKTDNEGKFCIYVPDGKYSVRPVVSNVIFSPASRDVEVSSRSVMGLKFSQQLFTIKGTVKMNGKCPNDLTFSVYPSDDKNKPIETVTATASSSTDSVCEFTIESLVAGSYVVSSNSKSGKSSYCWMSDSETVTVGPSDGKVSFSQLGYSIVLDAGKHHVSRVDISGPTTGGKQINLVQPLGGAPMQLCLSSSGTYKVTPSDQTVKFEREEYLVSVPGADNKPAQVSMKATAVLVKGVVKVEGEPAVLLKEYDVLVDSGKRDVAVSRDTDDKSLSYAFWMKAGETAKISFKGPSHMLFTPPSETVSLASVETAASQVPTVIAKPGLFFRGKTVPPTPKVKVSLYKNEDNSLVKSFETKEDGAFTFGPLPKSRNDYTLSLTLDGYSIRRLSSTSSSSTTDEYAVERLSSLRVSVSDTETKTSLSGVLVAVSASAPSTSDSNGSPYHKTLVTDAAGTATFLGIPPGSYHVKPLLKEYSFEPSAATSISVAPGADQTVSFAAKRVAFSVFGTVRTMDGTPRTGASVAAFRSGNNEKQPLEQAQTDNEGKFRLRGLAPGQSFVVRLVSGAAQIPSVPSERTISVPAKGGDVHGVSFLIPADKTGARIVGKVVTPRSAVDGTKMQAVLMSGNGREVKSVLLGAVPAFEFSGLRNGTYKVTLRMAPAELLGDANSKKSQEQQKRKPLICEATPSTLDVLIPNDVGTFQLPKTFSVVCSGGDIPAAQEKQIKNEKATSYLSPIALAVAACIALNWRTLFNLINRIINGKQATYMDDEARRREFLPDQFRAKPQRKQKKN